LVFALAPAKLFFTRARHLHFIEKIYRLLIGKELTKNPKLVVRKDVFAVQSLSPPSPQSVIDSMGGCNKGSEAIIWDPPVQGNAMG
jgi:hypothetical protein